MPSAFEQFLTGNTFRNPSDEEAQAIRREADNAVEGATRRLAGQMLLGTPGSRRFRNTLEARKQELVRQLGWNNPQQAAAAMEAFKRGGYEGLRELGYDLPYTPEEPSDRAAASRHLAPPYAMESLGALRDIDLLLGVYGDGGEYVAPEDLKQALGYYKASYSNPLTHQDYGNPNYRVFAGDSPMDASRAIGHFIQDPQNPVANTLLAMDAIPNSVLAAAENDTNITPSGSRINALVDRLGRGMERTAATYQMRDTGAFKPVPVLDLPNTATGEERAARREAMYPSMMANQQVSGQQALHGLGVPDEYNTPAAGLGTEFGASLADPSLMNPALQAAQAGRGAAKSFAVDAASDIGINIGMTAAATPAGDERTWGEFFSQPYEPASDAEKRFLANERTKASAAGMGRRTLSDYSNEAARRGSLGGLPRVVRRALGDDSSDAAGKNIRELRAMYDAQFAPR